MGRKNSNLDNLVKLQFHAVQLFLGGLVDIDHLLFVVLLDVVVHLLQIVVLLVLNYQLALVLLPYLGHRLLMILPDII